MKPIELVFCLSAVSCWPPPYVEDFHAREQSTSLTDGPAEATDLEVDQLDPHAGDRKEGEG
ncbi:unnamed protein product [Dibothriocephalus latus]|uniref:Uncharacterized protein n=1 Tax=Dibothriocephalus latus TaxID=60516 RepID=A0A3P7LL00_DIBLA|nr:unnamed protein product [Dibothriocephalus latus]